MRSPITPLIAGAALSLLYAGGAGAADADAEAWLKSDDDPAERALAVNEGELAFLARPPGRPVHHHSHRLKIDAASLTDGWVDMQQCHLDLDPVGRAEIVFQPGRLRDLSITSVHNVGSARVEGASVQLEDIEPGARLCLEGRTRALRELDDGRFELRNGPFMRRFLDGYYPMRITLDIRYPQELELIELSPSSQPGFRPRQGAGRIQVDTWFEGRLHTRFRFARHDDAET